MNRVPLERGTPDRREVLANLAQLYMHDFMDLLAPERRIAVGEDGRFADDLHLDRYWSEAAVPCGSSASTTHSRASPY